MATEARIAYKICRKSDIALNLLQNNLIICYSGKCQDYVYVKFEYWCHFKAYTSLLIFTLNTISCNRCMQRLLIGAKEDKVARNRMFSNVVKFEPETQNSVSKVTLGEMIHATHKAPQTLQITVIFLAT